MIVNKPNIKEVNLTAIIPSLKIKINGTINSGKTGGLDPK